MKEKKEKRKGRIWKRKRQQERGQQQSRVFFVLDIYICMYAHTYSRIVESLRKQPWQGFEINLIVSKIVSASDLTRIQQSDSNTVLFDFTS